MQPTKRSRAPMIAWAVLAALSIPVACLLAVSTAFMGDAPGAGGSWTFWMFACGLLAAPLVALITLVLAIVAAVRNTRQWAWIALAPSPLWLAYMVAAFGALQVVCGGSFVCR